MKKLLFLLALVCAFAGISSAQISISVPNDTVTGTTLNKLAKFNTTASATSVIISATTDTTGAIGIVTAGAGTANVAVLTISGVAPCVFDNTTVANDYVQISSSVAGDCHDAGATRPTSGQILGTVFGAGGAAGTYNVSLNKDIYPSAAAAAPITLCNVLGSSDTLTAAGTFATTCSVSGLVQGSLLEIRAHGVYTTTATASPILSIQINAGGTTGICTHSGNNIPTTNQTNDSWDVVCFVHILTTGAPGTATTWGVDEIATTLGGVIASRLYPQGALTQSFTTNTAQTVSVQEIATLVTGQTLTLQELVVRNITAQ